MSPWTLIKASLAGWDGHGNATGLVLLWAGQESQKIQPWFLIGQWGARISRCVGRWGWEAATAARPGIFPGAVNGTPSLQIFMKLPQLFVCQLPEQHLAMAPTPPQPNPAPRGGGDGRRQQAGRVARAAEGSKAPSTSSRALVALPAPGGGPIVVGGALSEEAGAARASPA